MNLRARAAPAGGLSGPRGLRRARGVIGARRARVDRAHEVPGLVVAHHLDEAVERQRARGLREAVNELRHGGCRVRATGRAGCRRADQMSLACCVSLLCACPRFWFWL
jgi:hypothetical protein